jgi:UDP-N-acetylglucosamine--N-acetylmuramyl-(pentapeptide) pyrophosphoryl-undecaprenol N-acetylglucosamine transferase
LSRAYVIAAGGTGGHIFPAIALAREIQRQNPGMPVVFVGTARGLETRLVPEAGFRLEMVPASGFAGKRLLDKVAALAQLPAGFLEARRILARHGARAVAGVGGYVTIPVIAAARAMGIGTVVHESNARAGLANRLLNRIATKTAVGLEAANAGLARPGIVTGTPVRPEFFDVPPLSAATAGRRILLFGGSQGSRALNRAIAAAAQALAAEGCTLVHQAGEKLLEEARALYASGSPPAGVRLEAFLPRLWEELARADLVICRAGSQTLAELAAAGRPALLVPFGSATHGHQMENATAFRAAGAAEILAEGELSGERLAREALSLVSDPARLERMARQGRSLAHPDAARRLAQLLAEVSGGNA